MQDGHFANGSTMKQQLPSASKRNCISRLSAPNRLNPQQHPIDLLPRFMQLFSVFCKDFVFGIVLLLEQQTKGKPAWNKEEMRESSRRVSPGTAKRTPIS
jgi:hypothetical protein